MRQHKITQDDVARVIAAVVSHGKGEWATDTNDLPKVPWAQNKTFRTSRGAHNRLLLEVKENELFKLVVPVEIQPKYLRNMILTENSDVPLARDSGYHILHQRTMGISRRAWAAFLSKQSTLQRTQNIPVERRKGGVKLQERGHLECDLIEGKRKDVHATFLTDDWYWLSVVDRLTGYFLVKHQKNKLAKTTSLNMSAILDEMVRKLKKPILTMSSDKGGEFLAETTKMLKRRNIKQKFVDRGNRIEQCNQVFQRNFYRLYKLRRGSFKSLQKQALVLVNNTRNKYTRKTPNEALLALDKDLAFPYNAAREQSSDKYNALEIVKGNMVRHLINIRKRLKGVAYKAYRGTHWSAVTRKVTDKKRIGTAYKYLVGGSWYDRDSILLVPAVDSETDGAVKKRKATQDKKHVAWH